MMANADDIFDLEKERYKFEINLRNFHGELESFLVTKNTKIEDFLEK